MKCVPFLSHDFFYKCIAVNRRADGVESDAWLHLKGPQTITTTRCGFAKPKCVPSAGLREVSLMSSISRAKSWGMRMRQRRKS